MRQVIYLLLIIVVASGCRTSLRSNWRDFNAYYNTFYNAKENYNSGVKKNLGQARDYNPLLPIRIHETPVNAGAQDFNSAIEKGADVLRKYNDTKWVDDALELIGKSYYFRKEYYSADQKFKELYATTGNPAKQQEAIIWQGRLLLDMNLYNQGISYLTEELLSFEGEWDKKKRAEVKSLLAEHYVMNENWELAYEQLIEAIPNLPKKEYKERAYFLLGQIHERLGDPQKAFDAYDKVQDYYTEYRLQYLAKRKKAEVARNLERNDVAYSIFNDMVRDDKNTEYKAELDYELARTEQRRGNYEKAELIYLDLLHSQVYKPTPETSAKAFYSLAEIYRYVYDDFNRASAYYDSAAQVNADQTKLPEDFRAGELAESFGEYSHITSEIALQDSLIKLGQLSPQEFDSAMVQLRQQKKRELEQLRKEQEARQNTLVNVGQGVRGGNEDNQASLNSNGFLNIKNQTMLVDAKSQFRAYWGNRPLLDNWRVGEMIQGVAVTDTSEDIEGNISGTTSGEASLVEIEIDISNVPFTEQAQDSVRQIISEYQYQLGNLFFLSLDMPDSAAIYYTKAINNPAREEVNTVSYYSLSELKSIEGNENEARNYAQRLISQYPRSIYAERLAEKYDLQIEVEEDSLAADTLQVYQHISAIDSLSITEKASRYIEFSRNFSSSELAPQAMYDGIQFYMEKGKADSLYEFRADVWRNLHESWKARQDSFLVMKDSIKAVLADTSLTLSDSVRTQLTAVTDSTLSEPDYSTLFPYQGAFWDSARITVDEFLETFKNSSLASRVQRLKTELELPEEEVLQEEDQPVEEDLPQQETETQEGYVSCTELETELTIREGKDVFMANIELPEEISLREIVYQFNVNQRGVLQEYSLITEDVSEALSTAFETAFDNGITFEPVLNEGQAIAVQCNIQFDLSRGEGE